MTVGVIAAAALLFPASALASGTPLGVHVDPGSPAGKQYQLPVSSARGEASGGGGSTSSAAPLFGVGITPSGPAGPGAATGSTATSTTHPSARSVTSRATARAATALARKLRTQSKAHASAAILPAYYPADTSAGGSGWLALVGGGALVLVLGGGVGLLVRRRVLNSRATDRLSA
jgi:hypothetical protein